MSRKDKNSNQDIISNKILLLITISFISALVLMWIYRGYNTLGTVARTNGIVMVLTALAAIFVLFCCWWSLRVRKNQADESEKTLTSSNCMLGGLFALLSLWGIYHFGITVIRALYILIPIYVGLYFISKIYSKAAIWVSYLSVFYGLAFYTFNRLFDNVAFASYVTPALVILFVVSLILLNFFRGLQKGDGLIGKPGQNQARILPSKTKYVFLIITPILAAVFGIGYFFIGTVAMRYGFFAMSGYLLIAIIYYTFELMNQ